MLINSTLSRLPKSMVEDDPFLNLPHSQIVEYVVIAALSCSLYGIFLLLCSASIYSLVQLNARNRRTTITLSFALLVLFGSTTAYTVSTFMAMLKDIFIAANLVSPITQPLSCVPTVALTINIVLGDAIVCWRAYVVWRSNKIIMGGCIMLLLATFALGVTDTKLECQAPEHLRILYDGEKLGSLYQGLNYGLTATALSFLTNLFATIAVMVKAWQSRRALAKYVVTGPMASQMEKMLSLLVESGMAYCGLWAVVLIWQGGIDRVAFDIPGKNDFWDIFAIIVNGALVPLIAIYPAVIIVLVALNRSHIAEGFATPNQSVNAGHRLVHPLAIGVNTSVMTHYDARTTRGSESTRVLVIGKEVTEEVPSTDTVERLTTHSAEEGKLGYVV